MPVEQTHSQCMLCTKWWSARVALKIRQDFQSAAVCTQADLLATRLVAGWLRLIPLASLLCLDYDSNLLASALLRMTATPARFKMQVLRLCWRYGLLTALTYILNRGLNDYIGPAAHLLMALLRPSAQGPGSDSKAAGYRLLVYLRCCLTGCSFPPGVQAMLILVLFPCQQCC